MSLSSLLAGLLILAVVSAALLAGSLARVRARVRDGDARDAAAQKELAATRRRAAQAEADQQFLARFVRELPHMAHELHKGADGRNIPGLLVTTVNRLLEPRITLVAVARRSEIEPGGRWPLAVAAVAPEGCVPIGSQIMIGEGEIGFAVEVQRVMDRRDFEGQPAAVRRRLREQSGPESQPDVVAPMVFDGEATGVIAIEGPKRSTAETKDVLRLIAHVGAVSLYTRARYSAMKETASVDGLTGIYNKRYLTQQLAEEIQNALAKVTSVSVFIFDVDNFKHYNDTNGHLAGDRVLQGLAKLAQEKTRKDTIFGRFGGEEFLMIFPGATKTQAFVAAEHVREAIATHDFPFGADQPLGRVSVSGGVAECPLDATDSAGVIHAADQALYAAKTAGRNRVLIFEPRYLSADDSQEIRGEGKGHRSASAASSATAGGQTAPAPQAEKTPARGTAAGGHLHEELVVVDTEAPLDELDLGEPVERPPR